jgi:hypothetical protein
MSMMLTLPARHDLVSMAKDFLKPPKPDSIEIMVELEPEAIQGYMLAICPIKTSKFFVAARRDLAAVSKKYEARRFGLPSSLAVHTTNPDIVSHL